MPFPKETKGSMRQRAEVIKQSPEWQAMVELSQNPEFLEILEAYWQKFSTKRGKTFEEELGEAEEKPGSRYYLQDDKITNGSIKLKFLREIENYLGSKITCNSYFTIFCDLEANLLIGHREFIDGDAVKKFEGTLDEFYNYMKEIICPQLIEKVLTNGLLEGYTNGSSETVERGTFKGRKSVVVTDEGTYHDEWFVATHSGGGQELVNTPNGSYTRLYGGGSPKQKELSKLDITTKDVSAYLKKMIIELGNKTRLTDNCTPSPDRKWQYTYKITSKHESTSVVTATEVITYDGVEVHVHAFILCPIL